MYYKVFTDESIPVKCYELVSKENEEQQEKLLKLLEDVIEYKR